MRGAAISLRKCLTNSLINNWSDILCAYQIIYTKRIKSILTPFDCSCPSSTCFGGPFWLPSLPPSRAPAWAAAGFTRLSRAWTLGWEAGAAGEFVAWRSGHRLRRFVGRDLPTFWVALVISEWPWLLKITITSDNVMDVFPDMKIRWLLMIEVIRYKSYKWVRYWSCLGT